MKNYLIYPEEVAPAISEFYQDVDTDYRIDNLDISYFSHIVVKNGITTTRCPLLSAVWNTLVANFNLYYATREIGGETEYDFFNMLQSCLNRNADTYETQLEFYYQEVNKPVIGRTEKITYNITDKREQDIASLSQAKDRTLNSDSGADLNHHVEVPADAPQNDTDRTRDKYDYGKKTSIQGDSNGSSVSAMDDEQKRTGTQTVELSSLGIKPNVEYMNDYLNENKTFIQYFIESFEECFAPRYKRVYF